MRSRALRVTVLLLALAAIASAAYHTWTVHRRAASARSAAAAVESAGADATRAAYELRAAQQAYVASGQSEAFWFGKVTASAAQLRGALDTLSSSASSGAVRAAVEVAGQALLDFEQVDRRARGYVSAGQLLLASDMIYSDGLETSGRILAALHEAASLARADVAAVTAAAERERLTAAAGAAAMTILALLLLAGRPSDDRTGEDAAPAESAAASPRGLDTPAARPSPEPEPRAARRSPDPDPRRKPEPRIAEAPAAAVAPRAPAQVELQGLAEVCTDLARLSDTASLPSVLERAARALDASGLVLWVADADGGELVPVAAHGYPEEVLSRMGSLPVAAENATAAAFRTGLVQTVTAEAGAPGAIAAPLVTASGCRGVMSAEVLHDGERQPARLAAASIVAAQLATLVGPPAVQAQDRNTAAL